MSHVLTINGKEYLPAREVGKHFGYTRDYILTLARDGKIDAEKVGHRWYANLASAEKYFATAKIHQELRKNEIRNERKAELLRHTQVHRAPEKRTHYLEISALAVSAVLLLVIGYSGVEVSSQRALTLESGASFMREMARSLYELFTTKESRIVVGQDTVEREGTVSESEKSATTTHTSVVVGNNEVLTTTTIESIRDSFSDDVSVSVDPHDPDTGVIVPHFRERDGEEYRFLMVPVTTATKTVEVKRTPTGS